MGTTYPLKLLEHFAWILDYPTPSLQEWTKNCISLLEPLHSEAANLLKGFSAFLDQTPEGGREEIYVGTFDLQAVCFPYVGHHLFREDHQRALFMAGLKEDYGVYHFSEGGELPDRLSVMLRFLATGEDAEQMEIVDWCILPALKKMLAQFADRSNPYRGVLQSLFFVLKDRSGDGAMG
ncbi:MAG: hypothetical protein EHM36_04760 [Deltaproteobacteria bacterium]|nr:MAG: hypothetical protein EHM36_04760 [Deltaproteobacteria bacterium]